MNYNEDGLTITVNMNAPQLPRATHKSKAKAQLEPWWVNTDQKIREANHRDHMEILTKLGNIS